MTRDEIEAQRLKERDKNRRAAEADLLSLHDRITNMLRSNLPSVFNVEKITQTSEQGAARYSVRVTEVASQVSWSIRLAVTSTGRYSWSTGFAVEATGDSYIRERRTFEPHYAITKSGWNYERMAADAQRAIAARISARAQEKRRAESTAASATTFAEVLGHVGGKPAYPAAHYASLKTPLFTIELSAGDIHGGAVRVKVSLDKNCVSGQEAVRLIEMLQGLK